MDDFKTYSNDDSHLCGSWFLKSHFLREGNTS